MGFGVFRRFSVGGRACRVVAALTANDPLFTVALFIVAEVQAGVPGTSVNVTFRVVVVSRLKRMMDFELSTLRGEGGRVKEVSKHQ